MSEEDTVSYHDEEESGEEEYGAEGRWSEEVVKKYKITEQEVIHKIRLHERINKLEKENARLNKLLKFYQISPIETVSFALSDLVTNEKKRQREQCNLFDTANKKVKLDVHVIDLNDYDIGDCSLFL